jgi:hypothetical protein
MKIAYNPQDFMAACSPPRILRGDSSLMALSLQSSFLFIAKHELVALCKDLIIKFSVTSSRIMGALVAAMGIAT